MGGDQMDESPELTGETVRSPKRLGGEGGQVVDVMRASLSEEPLEEGVGQYAGIEGVLEAVERLLASRMFKERGHVRDSRE
jgi:hypothetical protein